MICTTPLLVGVRPATAAGWRRHLSVVTADGSELRGKRGAAAFNA